MQVETQRKYAFKNKAGVVVMLLDDLEHAKRWYNDQLSKCGPMMPTYTFHRQIFTQIEMELPA